MREEKETAKEERMNGDQNMAYNKESRELKISEMKAIINKINK